VDFGTGGIMIKVKNLTKKYGDFTAVDNISFTVQEGTVCVIIGPSGCGKSTTLKTINRMLEPTAGDIFIDGKNVLDLKLEILRRGIGYVIQYVGLFPHMTVGENIAVVPKLLDWGKSRIGARVALLLEMVGLDPSAYRDKYPNELSGGEAQRIGVARALAADPPILLMDEPFGAVDPLNREVLQREFVRIQRELKKTVLFVTHDLDEAVRIADRIIIMKNGTIVQNDIPEIILASPKNKFVHDFVGSDRALKRLSRFIVSQYMHRPVSVEMGEKLLNEATQLREQKHIRYIWVVDSGKRLIGWLDTGIVDKNTSIEDAVTKVAQGKITVREDSTLREVLAKMLGEGVKVVPVVDADRRVIGEVSLKDIEKITEEVDASWKE